PGIGPDAVCASIARRIASEGLEPCAGRRASDWPSGGVEEKETAVSRPQVSVVVEQCGARKLPGDANRDDAGELADIALERFIQLMIEALGDRREQPDAEQYENCNERSGIPCRQAPSDAAQGSPVGRGPGPLAFGHRSSGPTVTRPSGSPCRGACARAS